MIQPLRIDAPDHKVFMVSDLHARHARVAAKRGYGEDVAAHDADLVKGWNGVCDADSHVVVLGDAMSDDPTGAHLTALLKRLSFNTAFLLPGNHASGWSALYKQALKVGFPDAVRKGQLIYEVYPLTMTLEDTGKTIVFLPNLVEIKTGDALFCASHYPVVSHNRMGQRSIHVHGHSHQGCHLTNRHTGRGLRLDVGWEGWQRPVSVSEIKLHLAGREIDAWDHHGAPDSAESPGDSS